MYSKLKLIDAEIEDYKLVYECRFSEEHIKHSIIKNKPDIKDSKEWFTKNYLNFKIILYNDKKIGYIINDYNKSVHISLLKEYRNLGIGSEVLKMTKGWTYILDENIKSIKAFENAGYKKIGVLLLKE